MQINLDDIMFSGEWFARDLINFLGNKEIKSNSKISGKVITNARDKYSWEKILMSEHGIDIVMAFIRGSITEYHDQLRKKLLEMSIDIGEMDIDTAGTLRAAVMKSAADGELDDEA